MEFTRELKIEFVKFSAACALKRYPLHEDDIDNESSIELIQKAIEKFAELKASSSSNKKYVISANPEELFILQNELKELQETTKDEIQMMKTKISKLVKEKEKDNVKIINLESVVKKSKKEKEMICAHIEKLMMFLKIVNLIIKI